MTAVTARRAVAGAAAVVLAALTSTYPAAPARAEGSDGLVTTSSTRTVAWGDVQRADADLADRKVSAALGELKVRVSQSEDLLNQTVQVTWSGVSQVAVPSLALMQCWSDGPEFHPAREQCAYGGATEEDIATSGSARTRAVSGDPRETSYRSDADLGIATVNGATPGKTWSGDDQVVLGNVFGRTCPTSTAAWKVDLFSPRAAVVDGTAPATLPITAATAGRPGAITSPRAFATATAPFTFAGLRATPLPLGQYRVELNCTDATGVVVYKLAGFVLQSEKDGVRSWSQPFHEGGVNVPFDPLGDTADTRPTDPFERLEVLEYLKPRSTNEQWQVRTRPNGTGEFFFEVQTDLEAQHLGCGRLVNGVPRSCWLVAVPRVVVNDAGTGENNRETSPLTQTNWDRRVDVPLRFAPVASGCSIGSGLKQVLSHDSALSVLRSWQPTFCGDAATAASVLGPLQDSTVRAGISSPNRMGVVTVPAADDPPTVLRAPIATSGVVVAFSVDKRIRFGSDLYDLDGTRATTMNLTPRLLAKLLTQSYDSGAAPNGGYDEGYNSSSIGGTATTFAPGRNFPRGNPRTLYDDPEFLAINPEFAAWLAESSGLSPADMADVLVSVDEADAYAAVWSWVTGDGDAAAFLHGEPDPSGMTVNPYYKDQIAAGLASFPQLDPTCADAVSDPAGDGFPLLCQLNVHPRADDDADAAQAVVRGDSKRNNVAPTTISGVASDLAFRAAPRQGAGRTALMAITTSGVAARFGLPTAALRNKDGRFVQPTTAALALAREQMAARADGVLVADPPSVGGEGYPLTTNSYAVVDLASTTQAQNDAFAKVLDYAAGNGQRPGTAIGQLPPGYAPLSRALSDQTRAAAAVLRDPKALLAGEAPDGEPEPPTSMDDEPAGEGAVEQPVLEPGAPSVVPGVVNPADPVPPLVRGLEPTVAPPVVAFTARTAAAARYAVPLLAFAAVAAAVLSRVLRTLTPAPAPTGASA